ncbi:hypothetical protein PFICI_13825 [Pestalotiopsis fici W106-1]|uniref:Uncharacterized protein n=1 Tax=Pestalotiopsis fici (strain W106-1 / CGMCC3.15140) TaxID=1229662 RepID=W3WJL1_PESFW|nr:uncharacterized protein PFICI_13825 [Pestalotiopsis fici W106-1]ETS73959.1 hypothetical protein PFICI_13825 [Pestalotiopsis fici W106-1]
MFKSIATWALLASAAVYAAPAEEISSRAVLKGLADFERVSTTSQGTSQIGYYGGLQYNGLGAVTAGTSRRTIPGLYPRSGTNVAAFGNAASGLGNPVITSQFSGSKTANFTIGSLFFGCVDASNQPVGCKLALAGYNSRGVLIAYQAFYFTPSGGATNNLSPAYLDAFVGVSTVRLAAAYYFFANSINSINFINDIANSINDLANSINDLTNSINDLANSINDLANSINSVNSINDLANSINSVNSINDLANYLNCINSFANYVDKLASSPTSSPTLNSLTSDVAPTLSSIA